MLTYLYVAVGGALGSVARYAIGEAIDRIAASSFPWGTLIVNISGSLLIGMFAALTVPDGRWPVPQARLFLMTGICGGYTTFSAFSLQTLTLAREGEAAQAGLYILASVIVCLVGVWLGFVIGTALNQTRGA